MSLRSAYLRALGAHPDEEILWCITGNGFTRGSLRPAAEVAMQETALYLAESNDIILLSNEQRLLQDGPSGWIRTRLAPCKLFRCAVSPVGGMDQWLLEHTPQIADWAQEIPFVFHSPVTDISSAAFQQAGFRCAISSAALSMQWEEKPAMHTLLDLAGVPRPLSWLLDLSFARCKNNLDEISRVAPDVVVKRTGHRPRVCKAKDLDTSLIDSFGPTLVEVYHPGAISLNFQYLIADTTLLLLSSVQLVVLTSEGYLMHCGNVRPAEIIGQRRWSCHAASAHAAADAVYASAFRGVVGIDTFESGDGAVLVSDVNTRINASTFLSGVPEVEPTLFSFGLITGGMVALSTFYRTLERVEREIGCAIALCFSPVLLDDKRVAVNLLFKATTFDALCEGASAVCSRVECFKTPMNTQMLRQLIPVS